MSNTNHFNPFDKWDMELLRIGYRGFSLESMQFFAEKAKDKKFMEKLLQFYYDS